MAKGKRFDFNFNGDAPDGINYGCGMRIAGEPEVIGRMLAEYVHHEVKRGHPEPMRILVAANEQMQRLQEKESKIFIPSIIKPGQA